MRLVRLLVAVGAICASTSMASAQAIDWQKSMMRSAANLPSCPRRASVRFSAH